MLRGHEGRVRGEYGCWFGESIEGDSSKSEGRRSSAAGESDADEEDEYEHVDSVFLESGVAGPFPAPKMGEGGLEK